MIEVDKKIYGVNIIQDAPFRRDEKFELVPFTDGDAEFVREAVLELMKKFQIIDWKVTEIHFK